MGQVFLLTADDSAMGTMGEKVMLVPRHVGSWHGERLMHETEILLMVIMREGIEQAMTLGTENMYAVVIRLNLYYEQRDHVKISSEKVSFPF